MLFAGLFFASLIIAIGANLITGDPIFGSSQAALANVIHGIEISTDSGQSGFIEQLGNIVSTAWRGVIFPFVFLREMLTMLFWLPNAALLNHPLLLLVKIPFWAMSIWGIYVIVATIRGR